jgi:phosphate transport system permease protein
MATAIDVRAPVEVPPDDLPENDVPRALKRRSTDDHLSLAGSIIASFALVWVVYYGLLPLSGVVGFTICWYSAFLALYAGVSILGNDRTEVLDRVMGAAFTCAAVLVGFALVTVVWYTLHKGWPAIHHLNFFTKDGAAVGSNTPLNKGGIKHAIVGSAIQMGIATAVSLPLGIGTAVFMSEVGGWFSRVVRTVVEAMTAVPDLLAGLFVYVTLIVGLHMEKDGLAAAIAISVTMTPIIARSAEVSLRLVPGGLREAGLALASSQWQTVRRIVLPTAKAGLATSMILAIARGVGESAPLLIVSQESKFFNGNPLAQPMNSLPLYIYRFVRSGQPLLISRAFGAASVLLVLVLLLFGVTRFLARQRVSR